MKTLYLLTTRKLGDYYIVANSPNEAKDTLKKILDLADYGFNVDRTIDNIKIVTNEVIISFNGSPNFTNEHKLLLQDYWGKQLKNKK